MQQIFKSLVLIICLITLASCNVVRTKDLVTRGAGALGADFSCYSTAGEYGLPKSLVTIEVTEDRNLNNPSYGDATTTKLEPIAQRAVRDKRQTFCLDFLSAFNSNDEIMIEKDAATGLLKEIYVNADDQLPTIFETVEKELTTLSRATVAPTREPIKFVDEFDPMRPDDRAVMNARLRDFGICILVNVHGQGYFDLDAEIKRACNRKISSSELTSLVHKTDLGDAGFQVLPEDYQNSILYRPTVTADIYVMRQQSRARPHKWNIYEKQVLTLIDSNSIHGLHIRRAVFAKRETKLTFEDGVLTTVFVDKGSEIAGFVNIPLSIVRSIVRLPTELIQIRIGEQNSLRELINAQSQLIEAEEALRAQQTSTQTASTALIASQNSSSVLSLSTASLNQCVANCQAGGNDGPTCTSSCSCKATCPAGNLACQTACGP